MQPCNRIYYSTVHWRLNMFRAAYRSPSGALTVYAAFSLRLDYGRSPHAYANQRLQIQLELLMISGMPLETCWAFNERWNNKFYYKVASCWLFLLSQTKMHESMNNKSIPILFSHLRLGLPSGLLPSGFPTKTLYTLFLSPIRATCPAHLNKIITTLSRKW